LRRAIDIARISARGSVILSLGMVTSNLIMALATFIIAGLLPRSDYGLYSVILVVPSFFSLFQGLGTNLAIIKYVAQYRSEGRRREIRNILTYGLIFNLLVSILLAVASFLSADYLAGEVFHRPGVGFLIKVISIGIFMTSMIATFNSIFVGFERMEFNSLTMILQAVSKCLLSPTLILLGYGLLGVIMGDVASSTITAAFSFALFILYFYRRIASNEDDNLDVEEASMKFSTSLYGTLSLMLRYGLPLSASTILNGILTQFYNFMMAIHCSDVEIADYRMATNFTVLINFFIFPISTVLFPAFSKLSIDRDRGTLRVVFQSSVKYSALLVVPASVVVMALSKPLVCTLFGEKFHDAPLYLSLIAISYLYVGAGRLTIDSLINGQGRTDVTLKLTLIMLSVGVPLGLLLIPQYGIIGLITTSLVSMVPSLAVGLWWVRREFGVSVDVASGVKIYISSGVAGLVTYLLNIYTSFTYWVSLAAGGAIFLLAYLIMILLVKAVDENDIENMSDISLGLGPLHKVINPILEMVKRLL